MSFIFDYFTNDKIFSSIARIRLATLDKRSKLHADREISTHHKTDLHKKRRSKSGEVLINLDEEYLFKVVPPRSQWVTPNSHRRANYLKSSKERNKFSLDYTYKKTKELVEKDISTTPIWYSEFIFFCDYIRYKVENIDSVGLERPSIIPISKKKKKSDQTKTECRPLAKYSLEDRIIIGLTAKYFVDTIDSELQDNHSFAFRKKYFEKESITHHSAFNEIINFKKIKKPLDLFVAECDIKKFFDCVDHETILTHLDIIEKRLIQKGIYINKVAKNVFSQYLKSYSFNIDVLPKNNSGWFDSQKEKDGVFLWEEDKLSKEFGYDFSAGIVNIGVPQGGALSCVISNIILDSVDRYVLQIDSLSERDNDLFYVRYCDDMVLMHPDKQKCFEALNRYKQAILDSKLLIHPFEEDFNSIPYSKAHWKYKSKSVYKWAEKTKHEITNVPWVGFVGYQLRYDGTLRVRKDSIKKQKIKIKEEAKRILKAIDHNPINIRETHELRVNSRSIVNAYKARLISLSVGKINLRNPHAKDHQYCWAKGFQLLQDSPNPIILSHLKNLDGTRTFFMNKINKQVPTIENLPPLKGRKNKKGSVFQGTPFSYYRILSR